MGRITDAFGIPENEYVPDDLVTGTPVKFSFKYWTKDQWSFMFECVKLIQRVIMVVLTAGLIYVMLQFK